MFVEIDILCFNIIAGLIEFNKKGERLELSSTIQHKLRIFRNFIPFWFCMFF